MTTSPRAVFADRAPARSAREAALDVLQEFWTDDDGKVDFPVDPVVLAKRVGAEVVSAKLDEDVSGLLVKERSDAAPRIYLNSGDSERRQRFTCAHELGHLAKRQQNRDGKIGYVDSRDAISQAGTDPEEIWANQFAAELLMPAAAVRMLWSKGLSVARLAKTFGVSHNAVEVRLASLGLS